MTLDVLGIQNGSSRSSVDHEESYKQLEEMEKEQKKLGTVKYHYYNPPPPRAEKYCIGKLVGRDR